MNHFVLNTDKCKGCGLCVRACPKKLLTFGGTLNAQGNVYPVMQDDAACVACSCCALNCPDMRITINKED